MIIKRVILLTLFLGRGNYEKLFLKLEDSNVNHVDLKTLLLKEKNNLTRMENDILKYNSKSLLIAIPWLLPFIFFFPSPAKVLSILVYLSGLLGGLIFYRIKNKNKIIDMIDNEEKEKLEQEKKEELGKSK